MASINVDAAGVPALFMPGLKELLRQHLDKAVREMAEPLIQEAVKRLLASLTMTLEECRIYEENKVELRLFVNTKELL